MLCPHYPFISLFAMNQIYGCLRCMKPLDIIRIIMVVSVISVVHSISIFLSEVKKSVVSVVRTVPWLSCFEACPENGSESRGDRIDGIWLTCASEKLEKTKQTRLDFSKLLKILIGNENQENFHEICYDESKYFSLIQRWHLQTKFYQVKGVR